MKGPLTPQISPLRCAPVEMTKGRAALPATVVAEQDPFFIALVGQRPLTPPVEMTKGGAALPATGGAEQTFFIPLGGSTTHESSGRDDKGEAGASGECSSRTEAV